MPPHPRAPDAAPSATEGSRAPLERPPTLRAALLAGVSVALVGSLIVGLVESLLAAAMVARKLHGEDIPGTLLVAAVGRATLTHALLWIPVMIVVALGYWGLVRRRPCASPVPALVAVFIILAGSIVVYADLELAGRAKPSLIAAGLAAVLAVAAIKYVVQRYLYRALGRAAYVALVRGVTIVGLLVVVGTVGVFARSPLFDPGRWRVPSGPVSSAKRTRPNVLWIVLDTARADRMSCYGYRKPTTPFLDEWARRSLVCDLAIANGMWTVPAHASMFTGLSLREHGTDHRNLWLDDSLPTVADVLATDGYATALFSNNPLVSPGTNLTKGFQTRRIVYHLRRLSRFSLDFLCETWGVTPPLPWLDQDYGATLTNFLVARWLDDHRDDPKLVFINYMETHLPYRVPQPYRRMFLKPEQVDRSYDLRHHVYGNLMTRLDFDYNISGSDFLSASDRAVLQGQYDGAVRYLDDRVREVVELFEQRELLDNTLVVIVSDHGEYLATHGMWGHRFLTYQDLARVALLIRKPGVQAGGRVSTPVQLSDLYATVLKAVGGQPGPLGLPNSRDLFASDERGDVAPIAICECGGPAPVTLPRFESCAEPVVLHRTTPQIAAVGLRFKLINSGDGQRELYDLQTDPGELHNAIDRFPAEAEQLDAHLRQWLESTPAYTPPVETGRPPSPDVLQSLRSLGYVGEDDE